MAFRGRKPKLLKGKISESAAACGRGFRWLTGVGAAGHPQEKRSFVSPRKAWPNLLPPARARFACAETIAANTSKHPMFLSDLS